MVKYAHSIRKREKLQRVANRKPHLQLVWSVTPLNVFTILQGHEQSPGRRA
jgi:hypothetical protein